MFLGCVSNSDFARDSCHRVEVGESVLVKLGESGSLGRVELLEDEVLYNRQ